MKYPLLDMCGMKTHLFAERFCDHFSYSSIIVSEQENKASFLLYGMTGKLVGYQRYNPYGENDKSNNGEGKYYTYSSEYAPWGVESLQTGRPLALVEGVFDACVLHKLGFSALAMFSHSPAKWYANYINKVLRYRHPYTLHLKDGDGLGKVRGADKVLTCPKGEDPSSMGFNGLREFLVDNDIELPRKPLDFLNRSIV